MPMSSEQEERLFSILRHRNFTTPTLPPWESRLALVLVVLQENARDFEVLYTHGGGHPEDLDKARLCDTLSAIIGTLFPELAE